MTRAMSFSIVAAVMLSGCIDREPLTPSPDVAPSFAATALRGGTATGYTLRDLSPQGIWYSTAADINGRGQVVGQTDGPFGQHGFLWTASGGMVALANLGGSWSYPAEINDHGVMVGFVGDAAGAIRSAVWTAPDHIEQIPAVGVGSLGVSINEFGDIAGCFQPSFDRSFRPFVLTKRGGLREIPNLGGEVEGFGCAEAINIHGVVVGRSPRADGRRGAFIWTAADGMRDIGSMSGGEPWAYAMNDHEEVVGWEDGTSPNGKTRAFIWTAALGFTDLGVLPFMDNAQAWAINNRGEVVGQSWSNDQSHTFIWTREGGMRDLGVGPGTTWATAISNNDDGEIVGWSNVEGSAQHASVWNPVQTLPGMIVFASAREGNYEIYTMRPDGSQLARLTNNTSFDFGPVWSPDGKQIAFDSDRDGNIELYVMNADGTGLRRLTYDPSSNDGEPSWSPDGTRLAYRCNADICVINANGTGIRRLDADPAWDGEPAWSPTGEQIVFESLRADPNSIRLFVINSDGSGLRRLTDMHSIRPAWSPDGATIVFGSTRDGNDELYTIRPDGSFLTRMTNDVVSETEAAWSPDGLYFVFTRGPWSNQEVYLMSLDGSDLRQLTITLADEKGPSWTARAR